MPRKPATRRHAGRGSSIAAAISKTRAPICPSGRETVPAGRAARRYSAAACLAAKAVPVSSRLSATIHAKAAQAVLAARL